MTAHPANQPAAIQPGGTAVITGGASGIGLAAAARLYAAGMNIAVVDWRIPETPGGVRGLI